jgi:hypothetical protein
MTVTAPCRFCAAPLPANSRYCRECKMMQGWRDRLLSGVNLSSLVALVPVVTLAVAFLNQTIVLPRSRVAATVSACTRDAVVIALSNTGTRTAIVEAGTARFVPAKADYDRALAPPGGLLSPIVIKAGEAQVQQFSFGDSSGSPLPAPLLPEAGACRYAISLAVLEFGGERASVAAGQCTC